MNLLSVVVPAYNTERYLENCVRTLLESGDGIEILIVNDGSKDGTASLAESLRAERPEVIRVFHQENAGHGGAVNTGIQNANGAFIKVVDSDDWVNPQALRQVVDQLRAFENEGTKVDMVLANFMYDKVGETHKKIMHYRGVIPQDRIITWEEMKRFSAGKYILMHSVIYSRDVLRRCRLELPKHTFYVDNLFVYLPIPYVGSLYYMDLCVYHYFIGREDQSVNEKNMMRRIDQQLRVNHLMLSHTKLKAIEGKKRKKYMLHYLTIITTVSSILLLKIGTEDALRDKQLLWRAIKAYDYRVYLRMRLSLMGTLINLPGVIGRKIALSIYEIARRRVGFN